MREVVAAIDQGTTSTRCILFDHDAQIVAVEQVEHRQILPRPRLGRARRRGDLDEHPARARRCGRAGPRSKASDIAAIGITNQRETTVVWDRATGEPVGPAIVWQDTRTQSICDELGALGGGADRYRERTGLPLATYFAGPKVRWILDNVDGARARAETRRARVRDDRQLAAVEPDRRRRRRRARHRRDERQPHAADGSRHAASGSPRSPTRWASRSRCCPRSARRRRCTRRRASAARWPACRSPASSATSRRRRSGRRASSPGEAKNTYGTGNFLLLNTGTEKVISDNGLLTTVCYALEGHDTGLRARGLDRGHRVAGAVAARQPRPDRRTRPRSRRSRARSTTTAAPTSSRRSPACSRRTGAPTPAARSSG